MASLFDGPRGIVRTPAVRRPWKGWMGTAAPAPRKPGSWKAWQRPGVTPVARAPMAPIAQPRLQPSPRLIAQPMPVQPMPQPMPVLPQPRLPEDVGRSLLGRGFKEQLLKKKLGMSQPGNQQPLVPLPYTPPMRAY